MVFNKPTCFKNPDKPTCIDLIWTNQPNCFQHSNAFKTGLSNFYLLTVTEFKMDSQQLPLNIVNYCDYKDFENQKYSGYICKFDVGASDMEGFKNAIFSIFKKHVFTN